MLLNLTLCIFVAVVFLCAVLEYPPLQKRHPYSPKCDIDIDFETLGNGQTGRSCLMGGPAPPYKNPEANAEMASRNRQRHKRQARRRLRVDTEPARRRGERTLRLILKPVLVLNNTQRLGFRGGLVRVKY